MKFKEGDEIYHLIREHRKQNGEEVCHEHKAVIIEAKPALYKKQQYRIKFGNGFKKWAPETSLSLESWKIKQKNIFHKEVEEFISTVSDKQVRNKDNI